MVPADSWTSFRDLDRQSSHARSNEQLLCTADFSFLCARALQIRESINGKSSGSQNHDKVLTCSIDSTTFASGQYNVVLAIAFSDSQSWIARIRLPTIPTLDSDVEASMLSEITTMRLVRSRTSIPVPLVYSFDINSANPLGLRYLLLEALPRHTPDSRFSQSVPQNLREKFTEQLADYYYQLSTLRFEYIGSLTSGPYLDQEPHIGPCKGQVPSRTSIEYFYSRRKCSTKASTSAHVGDENWATAAWVLEQALPYMVVEEYLHGPFPLCHIDLHYNNILLDDECNITGIIDWSDSKTVPLERFIISPEFVTFPGLLEEQNAPIVAFRDMFASALRRREVAASGVSDTPPMSDIFGIASWETLYRCTYSFHWRALSDARLVMRQIYGSEARWEDFVTFYKNAPVTKARIRDSLRRVLAYREYQKILAP